MKFETGRIHFFKNVFAVITFEVAQLPNEYSRVSRERPPKMRRFRATSFPGSLSYP